MMKKNKNAIYAKTCDGSKEILLFHVRAIENKIYFTYEKNNKIIAQKSVEEVLRDIYFMPNVS